MRIAKGASIENSMISDGCVIEKGAVVRESVLSPGIIVHSGAQVEQSILLTDTVIQPDSRLCRVITDKRVRIGAQARIGAQDREAGLVVIGKNSLVPEGTVIEPGATVATDVIATDYPAALIRAGEIVQTKRQPYEI